MPLSESEELELLQLERDKSMLGEGKATGIRSEYPSEEFNRKANYITPLAGALRKDIGPGTLLAGAVSGGQEIVRQGIGAYKNEPGAREVPWITRARMIGQAAIEGAAGEGVARLGFKGVGKLLSHPRTIATGAQIMKTTAGIPEQTGKRVLSNPSILSNALPVEEAGKIYAGAMERTGLSQGPEAAMEVMGKSALSQEGAVNFAYDSIKKLEAGQLPYQEALVARDQLKNILKAPKFQNPNLAQSERFLIKMRDQLDSYLEPYFTEAGQGFKEARDIYGNAMTKREFSSWLPTNANKTASVLRGGLALGAVGAGAGGYVDPKTAALGVALASPKILGYGIRAGASPVTREILKGGVRESVHGIMSNIPNSTEELMRKKYNEQGKK